jgi:hypothetical protein
MAALPGSTAQRPERLFREPWLMAIVAALAAVFAITSFVDIPALGMLSGQHFIALDLR